MFRRSVPVHVLATLRGEFHFMILVFYTSAILRFVALALGLVLKLALALVLASSFKKNS